MVHKLPVSNSSQHCSKILVCPVLCDRFLLELGLRWPVNTLVKMKSV